MSNVDLSALRIDESSAAVPKRPLGPRLLVAGVIAVTLAVAATFLWPLLAPPPRIEAGKRGSPVSRSRIRRKAFLSLASASSMKSPRSAYCSPY